MNRKIRSTVLLMSMATATSFAHAQLSREQIENNRARWQSHYVAIDGSVSPSEIPYGERMRMAFTSFENRLAAGSEVFSNDIRARHAGSPADAEALIQAVGQNKTFVSAVTEQEARDLAVVCTDLVGDSAKLTPVELAERLQAIESKRIQALESHYRAVMQSLGAPMRASLEGEIDNRLVRQMSWGYTDHIGLANDFPGAYPRVMKSNCERSLARTDKTN